MARSKSSQRWLQEHHSDQYVKRSRQDGYRSRASYKLLELNETDNLFRPAMSVIDLGAAPGGWTQVVADHVGDSGVIIASDILSMDAVAGVRFIQGDFTEQTVLDRILTIVQGQPIDLVISDMAPNMTGIKMADNIAAQHLTELSFDLAVRVLRTNGSLVAKAFHGSGFDELLKKIRLAFRTTKIRKPAASRDRSSEAYIVAKGYQAVC